MTQFIKSYIIFVILSLSWVWGDCEEGEVELWGECYNIEETTFLQLSWNGLTGEIPPEIGNLTNLTKLWLYSNELTGEIPPEIGNLTNLIEFYLWENQLTGEIPPEIGNLINLDGIDLHSNQFAGEIPPTVGTLTNLTYLNFSNNELTGSIPPEIENLTNLGWLDFSFNQLTGSILPEIGNLSNLNRLGLYYNQLSEEIPEVICNLVENDCSILLYNNQLCPPYPECLTEEDLGYQDTTNCLGSVTVDYLADWNLVGLPVEVENPYYLTLFPDAIENTFFSFDDAYIPDSFMIEGEGYWLRFGGAGNTTITGNSINELTISLNEGWNLISGISISLIISDIQDPDGIIISGTIYGFAPGGYSNEEIIEPGKGYWLRANNSGNIILISP